MVIEHIDYIGRQKQRDVLFLRFHDDKFVVFLDDTRSLFDDNDYNSPTHPRTTIIKWLNENNIKWKPCAEVASECGWSSYKGQIYIDVPYDVNDPTYQKLADYLEDGNNNVKPEFGEHTKFYYITLEQCMTNAYHDEPGFWEKWADTF